MDVDWIIKNPIHAHPYNGETLILQVATITFIGFPLKEFSF